jgi:hypothetical protein
MNCDEIRTYFSEYTSPLFGSTSLIKSFFSITRQLLGQFNREF